jgi:transcriptional regulator with XRE-family HTH domain
VTLGNTYAIPNGMGFYDDIMSYLKTRASRRGEAQKLAKLAGVNPNLISRWINKQRKPSLENIGQVMDALGAKVVFEDEKSSDTTRPVHFVRPQIVATEDLPGPVDENYRAVPLASRPVAAGNGIIPADEFDANSWILVWTRHVSIRHRANLAAVEIDSREGNSMEPTLHPGDLVLIDRSEFLPKSPPGNIYLVQMPDGGDMSLAIKRVRMQQKNGHELVVFYSDNPEYGPEVFDLESDYDGDVRRAIKGRVVWSWSDMTKK